MPNVKISELPAATTPLAGTELVPIVQSGTTDKVTVADLTAGRAVSASALTASSGNLTFSGTAQRITGDFSNATVADRLMVQTTTTNGNTLVGVMPNGTGNISHISFYSSTDTVNGSFTRMGATSATNESYIQAGRSGTGTYYTLTFYAGGSRRVDIDTSGNLDIKAGNLSFSGTAQRITGDMSNATVANRLAFQTNTVNGNTVVQAVPNGTAVISSYSSCNAADPTNAAFMRILCSSTDGRLDTGISGTGTYLPMTFYTGGSERMRIDTAGGVGIGTTNTSGYFGTLAFPSGGAVYSHGNFMRMRANAYFNGTNVVYATSSTALEYLLDASGGNHIWYTAPSGTAGNTVTTTERMRIDSSGNVGIGTSSPSTLLHLYNASVPTLRIANNTTSLNTYVDANFCVTGSITNHSYIITTNNTERMRIDTSGNVVQNTAAVATNATAGFLWITSCAGAPTGAPSAPYTNAAALVCDTTNNRLYVRVGSTWRYATLT